MYARQCRAGKKFGIDAAQNILNTFINHIKFGIKDGQMTVIAQIPYKDGVLVVADSRATAQPEDYSSVGDYENKITYIDGYVKTAKSKDGNVITAAGGDVSLDGIISATVMEKADELESMKSGDTSRSIEVLRDKLKNVADIIGGSNLFGEMHANVLCTVRCYDGVVRTIKTSMNTEKATAPEDRVHVELVDLRLEMPEGLARGPDYIVQAALRHFVNSNCPDIAHRTMEDAVAAASMLENHYINQSTEVDTKFGRARENTVGAPVTIIAVQKDRNIELTMGKTEMSIISAKNFAQVKEFIRNKMDIEQMEAEARMARAAQPVAKHENAHSKLLRSTS